MNITVADLGIGIEDQGLPVSDPSQTTECGADVLDRAVRGALAAGAAPHALAAALLAALGDAAPVAWSLALSLEVAGWPESVPAGAFELVILVPYMPRFQAALEGALWLWVEPRQGGGRSEATPLDLALDANTPPAVLGILAETPGLSRDVRWGLTRNRCTPIEGLKVLAFDDDLDISEAALRHLDGGYEKTAGRLRDVYAGEAEDLAFLTGRIQSRDGAGR